MGAMYSIERKTEIQRILENAGRTEVNSLAKMFETSKETIRRDLREMEEAGTLRRTHGGAVFVQQKLKIDDDFPVETRQIHHQKEKDAICAIAAGFIEMDDSIFIDNSSTCLKSH